MAQNADNALKRRLERKAQSVNRLDFPGTVWGTAALFGGQVQHNKRS